MLSEQEEDEGINISGRWLGILLLGVTLLFAGIAVIVLASVFLSGSGSAGGIILIGPIPIVFGAGPDSVWLITISVIIAILSVVLFIFMSRRVKKE